MQESLGHRGPDDAGCERLPGGAGGGELALLTTRLAIVDLAAPAGPYFNEDRSVAVVFNGELYDHVQVRARLRARGHQLRSECDAELVAHLYEERGDAFVEELDGDFALVLWDARRGRLLAARDRIGVRPLYRARLPSGALVLASEAKAILALEELPARLSAEFLGGALFGAYTGRGRSMFAGIDTLAPATRYLWSRVDADASTRLYWSWLGGERGGATRAGALAQGEGEEALGDALERAVRGRVTREVQAGLSLSGGLDSAVVAGIAAQQVGPVPAFCLGFEDAAHDESARAQQHADALGVELEVLRVSAEDIAQALPETLRAVEFPLINAHAAARRLLAAHMRERGVRVVLSGEGSDELFAGYPFFASEARWRAGQQGRREGSGELGRALLDAELERDPHSPLPWASFLDQRCAGLVTLRERVLRPAWRKLPGPAARLRARMMEHIEGAPAGVSALAFSRQMALWQLHDYLIPALGDRVEMAHGLESRPVFLDRRVVELARGFGETELLGAEGQGKQVLRRSAARWLPPELRRVAKHPFLAPSWRTILAGPAGATLVERYLSAAAVADFGVFEPKVLSFVRARWSVASTPALRHDWLIGLALGLHILMEHFGLRPPTQP